MFDDYTHRFYNVLANRSNELVKDNFAKTKELAAWKEEVARHWDNIEVVSVTYDENIINHGIEVGQTLSANIVLDKHNLRGDLGVELVRFQTDPVTHIDSVKVYAGTLEKAEGSKLYFTLRLKASEAGTFKYAIRIYPVNRDLPHRMDFAYVKWINES
jgi:starch phosphorylase